MPKIFSQWQYGPEGNPQLQGYEHLNTLTAAALWFNLNFDTVMHLFVPGYQEVFYKGRSLDSDSQPDELVHNIYEYITVMENESGNLTIKNPLKEKTKIYKLKTDYYENRNNDIVSEMRA
ncbi:MAG: hypothetical protein Q8L81_08995 [Bacteroidota bacterium]|nr:hypothetical protein [Bacteroidota bacterium]